jgi:hypothetical protein
MHSVLSKLLAVSMILGCFSAAAVTHYVDLNSTSPVPPYTSWATAATVIQDAIDASTDGDLVLVTNGNYSAGGYVVYGSLMNRVAINKAVTVQSINGPAATSVYGTFYVGPSAVRCVYMTTNSALIGFTVTQGATLISGDFLREESGGGIWCEDSSATISNCIIRLNNSYMSGGGVVNGTLVDCTITGNTASKSGSLSGFGGGALNSTLNRCFISGNSAVKGAGAAYSTLNYCTISNNAATAPVGDYTQTGGGGLLAGIANSCLITRNSAYVGGGFYGLGLGSPDGVLNNCLVLSNYVNYPGGGCGGTYVGTVNNCTIVGNSGGQSAGALFGALNNCIVYNNWGSNFNGSFLNYCCTTPMPTDGLGNFTSAPLFANPASGDFHLNAASPCINVGNNSSMTNSTDLDGNSRIVAGSVDLGAYEVQLPIHYVNLVGANPVPPFLNWSTAATNIQNAVDVATNGDLVLVTNGVYATGGRRWFDSGTNRVTLTNSITLKSVNGPAFTLIVGNQVVGTGPVLTNAVRCVGIGNSAVLSGFTLTNGEGGWGNYPMGGGVANLLSISPTATVTNCVVTGNLATNDAGGGAYRVKLVNCLITKNSADYGGGACACTLISCSIVSNTASFGGGVYGSSTFGFSALASCTIVGNSASTSGGGIDNGGGGILNNCIVYYNSAPIGSNYTGIVLNHTCTTPLLGDIKSFTNAPLFQNLGAADLHLQSDSPCINAGNDRYVTNSTDLEGNPRIVGGTVDIGAYEFQSPASMFSYVWAQQYGLATDGSADFSDADGDGANNWQEWISGTVPTNSASALRMFPPSPNASGLTISWSSVSGKTYFLQRSSNLSVQPAFSSIQSNLVGITGTKVFNDQTATNDGPYFYRVGVQ